MRNSLSFAAICRLLSNLLGIATAFISIRLYNLHITKEVYGAIAVGLSIIGYLPLMSGGFRMALNQQMLAEGDEVAKGRIARFGQTLQSYFFVIVLIGGVAGMAAYSLLPSMRATGVPFPVYLAVGAAAAVYFQAGSQLGLLVALGEQVVSSIIQGLFGVVLLAILWICFDLGWGVWALPASTGFGGIALLLVTRVAVARTKYQVPMFAWRREADFWLRIKGVWRAAYNSLANQVGLVLSFTLDSILVGVLIGPGEAAIYGIVSRVMGISRQVLTSLSEAAWPRLTQESEEQRRAAIMRKVDRLNAWIVGCWHGAMTVTLHSFLGWLVKPDWLAGPLLIDLMIARNFLVLLASPHSYGLMSAGRFRELAGISWREVVIGLVAGTILSLTLGSKGTALAFFLATACISSWQQTRGYFQFARDTHWFAEWRAVVGRGLVGGICGLALSFLATRILHVPHVPEGLMAIVAGGISFGLPAGAIMLYWKKTGRIP